MVLASHQPHPTDTHPTLQTRSAAIGVTIIDFDKLTKADDDPASSLIAEAEAIEQFLSVQLQRFFVEDAAPKSMGEAISRRDDPADGLG